MRKCNVLRTLWLPFSLFYTCNGHILTHLVTHLVWPHRPENPPGRRRAWRISPWRSPSLFPLFLLTHLLKALMLEAPTVRWSSWFRLLITRIGEKILAAVSCTPKFNKFRRMSLVPLMFLSKVKRSFNLSLDSSLHILKTSMRSCLFLLSWSIHIFKQFNLSAYVFPFMLLIMFVNLRWTFSISFLFFIYSVYSRH